MGKYPMTSDIEVGTVLFKEGTRLPGWLRLESEPLSNGWKVVKNLDGHGLSRRIREAGWAFVHMAGEIRATALGVSKKGTVRRAVRQGFARRESSRFGCLEITQVSVQRILGLLYVMVSARPRLIQEEVAEPPSRNIAEWHRAKLAGA
jgi:hypothetical protein